MPIISPSGKTKKMQATISIESGLLEEIKKYCDFAKFEKRDEFFQKAAEYILSKDKEWQSFKNRELPKEE